MHTGVADRGQSDARLESQLLPDPTNEGVLASNKKTDKVHALVDDRVLLGPGIAEAKPAYSDVGAYQIEVGEPL